MTQSVEAFLVTLQQAWAALGLESVCNAPTATVPTTAAWVRFDGLGDGEDTLDVMASFLPVPAEETAPTVHILQFMAEFGEVTHERTPAVLAMLAHINLRLPCGNFGIMQEAGVVYLRWSGVVDLGLPPPVLLQLVDRQLGTLLHAFHLFGEAILEVAAGRATAEAALARTPAAQAFANP